MALVPKSRGAEPDRILFLKFSGLMSLAKFGKQKNTGLYVPHCTIFDIFYDGCIFYSRCKECFNDRISDTP